MLVGDSVGREDLAAEFTFEEDQSDDVLGLNLPVMERNTNPKKERVWLDGLIVRLIQ